jgi:hypothetical protein
MFIKYYAKATCNKRNNKTPLTLQSVKGQTFQTSHLQCAIIMLVSEAAV